MSLVKSIVVHSIDTELLVKYVKTTTNGLVETALGLTFILIFPFSIPYKIYNNISIIRRDAKYYPELLADIKTGYPKNSSVVKHALEGKVESYPTVKMYKTLLKAYNHYVINK